MRDNTARSQRFPGFSGNRSCQYCFTAKPGSVIGGLRMRTFSVLSNPVSREGAVRMSSDCSARCALNRKLSAMRSEEHTSELQSLMRISYAVFCLTKKKITRASPLHHDTKHGCLTFVLLSIAERQIAMHLYQH